MLGFDVEWDVQDGRLLTLQFAGYSGDGDVEVAVVDDIEGRRVPVEELSARVAAFVRGVGIKLPVTKKKKWKEVRVVLVAHFAAAELSMIEDALGTLPIQQIGGKAHFARLPEWSDSEGITWKIEIVDLFAFFPVGLAKIGETIGLPKLDEDPTQLATLLERDRARFDAYAARDAEIALVAFSKLRARMLDVWGVDPLLHPTMSSIASAIFKHRFMKRAPVPYKLVEQSRTRRVRGQYKEEVSRRPEFRGDNSVRRMACLCYWGGRVEAYVRGLVRQPVEELDVISLYPHAALLQPLPNEKTKWRQVHTLGDVERMEGFGRFTFESPKGCRYPGLPVHSKKLGMLTFPRKGTSDCTFDEVRTARRHGATIKIVEAYGFVPGDAERDHDVGRYMRHFLKDKDCAERGTLDHKTAKALLNSLVGKFAQRTKRSPLLALERAGRERGAPGMGQAYARAGVDAWGFSVVESVGGLWAPEWASLILGRARALMADLIVTGKPLLVSTDAVIVPANTNLDCPALEELKQVGSGLRVESSGDATFIVRSRLYAVLRKDDGAGGDSPCLGGDGAWRIVRAARHATVETPKEFAETVLACLSAGKDVAKTRTRTRLRSAENAARHGGEINEEYEQAGRTHFRWDGKRKLDDRDGNPFTSSADSEPYESVGRLEAAARLRKVRIGDATPKRRPVSKKKRSEVLARLKRGEGVREVARATGVPKSTVADMKAKAGRQAAKTSGGSEDDRLAWGELKALMREHRTRTPSYAGSTSSHAGSDVDAGPQEPGDAAGDDDKSRAITSLGEPSP